MSGFSVEEDESTVQLILVEILTRSEDNDYNNDDDDDNIAKSYDEDFKRVTEYLLSNANSNIVVKLACQTLEKVSINFEIILLLYLFCKFSTRPFLLYG